MRKVPCDLHEMNMLHNSAPRASRLEMGCPSSTCPKAIPKNPPFKRLAATQVKANPGDIVLNKLTIHRLLAVATAGSLGELMLSKLGL